MWRELVPGDDEALDELLLGDVETNLFLLSLAALPIHPGVWVGHFDDDRLSAVVARAGSLLVPYSSSSSFPIPWTGECPELIVGPRAASDQLLRGLPSPTRCVDQRAFVADLPPEVQDPRVRRAEPSDLRALLKGSIAMNLEDLGVDPRDRVGAEVHEDNLSTRIRQGRAWVLVERDTVLAQLFVGSESAWGCQIAGTWVAPRDRRRGLAAALVGTVVQELLRHRPRVGLHVREANVAAIRTYERVGFRPTAPFRLARWDPADRRRPTT